MGLFHLLDLLVIHLIYFTFHLITVYKLILDMSDHKSKQGIVDSTCII